MAIEMVHVAPDGTNACQLPIRRVTVNKSSKEEAANKGPNTKTATHLKFSLAVFRFYARLYFLPIELDQDTGQMAVKTSQWSRFMWKLMLALGVVHVTFLDLQLVRSILMPQHLNLVHFPLHFCNGLSQTLGLYFSYKMFSASEDTTVKIFNHVMASGEGEQQSLYCLIVKTCSEV